MRNFWIAAVILMTLLIVVGGWYFFFCSAKFGAPRWQVVSNEIVVRAFPSKLASVKKLLEQHRLEILDQHRNVLLVEVSGSVDKQHIDGHSLEAQSLHEIAGRLQGHPAIQFAHTNSVLRFHQGEISSKAELPDTTSAPNDPLLSQQWYLYGAVDASKHRQIVGANVVDAWKTTKGNPNDWLANIDLGMPANDSVELPFWQNSCNTRDYEIYTGPFDDYPISERSVRKPSRLMHSYMTSFFLGACTDNQYGMAAPNWHSRVGLYLLEDRTLYSALKEVDQILKLEFAPVVLNTSFGHFLDFPNSENIPERNRKYFERKGVSLLDQRRQARHMLYIAKRVRDKGIVWVAAAGNDGTDTDRGYPNSMPSVLSVGASDRGGYRWKNGNFGHNVDLLAPGAEVPILYEEDIKTIDGTSFASPLAASSISLIKDSYSDGNSWSWKVAKYLIQKTWRPLNCSRMCFELRDEDLARCRELWCEWNAPKMGIIDVGAAVELAKGGLPKVALIDVEDYLYEAEAIAGANVLVEFQNVGGGRGNVKIPCQPEWRIECLKDSKTCKVTPGEQYCLTQTLEPGQSSGVIVYPTKELALKSGSVAKFEVEIHSSEGPMKKHVDQISTFIEILAPVTSQFYR